MEIPDWRVTTAAQTWDQATTALQEQLSEGTWNTWFRDVHPVALDGDRLRLTTPNGVVCERIRSSYSGLIAAVLQDITGDDIVIDLTVESGPRVDEPVVVTQGPVTAVGSTPAPGAPGSSVGPPTRRAPRHRRRGPR